MLVVVGITFLVTTSPAALLRVAYSHDVIPLDTARQVARYRLGVAIVYLLNYLNNAINFVLYFTG